MGSELGVSQFVELIRKSGVVQTAELERTLNRVASEEPVSAHKLAADMVGDGLLTSFEAELLLAGKWRRFNIGEYRVLERLGSGDASSTYLCRHQRIGRLAAVKVLPTALAEEAAGVQAFFLQARALAGLNHPNVIRAYDLNQDDRLHFLVLEFVDGTSLEGIVARNGPLDVVRAAHYITQAALGLEHMHSIGGLAHREITPGHLFLNRAGEVKILGFRLAHFIGEEVEEAATSDQYSAGSPDYMAPEQAINNPKVDGRADIYGLGLTFYSLLTGRVPFEGGTGAQKVAWQQTRSPEPVHNLRPEVDASLAVVLDKMTAKDPAQRFQNAREVVEALVPWTKIPIGPPPEAEMPQWCPAVRKLIGEES